MARKVLTYMLALATSVLLVSCREKQPAGPDAGTENQKPVFPEMVSRDIEAGGRVEIGFNANMAWEVSIPSEQTAWFHLDDNGITAYKVKGGKGEGSVMVCTNSDEAGFEPRTCTLVMKMGGSEAEIARIVLLPMERSIAVYTAIPDAGGLYSGSYEYKDSPESELQLKWLKGPDSYILPVRISSNFSWSITADHPDWLTPSVTSAADSPAELVLRGNAMHYPLEDARGEIHFMDLSTQTVVASIPVSIEGCKDITSVSIERDTLDFNIIGGYRQNGNWVSEGCLGRLTAVQGCRIVALGGEDWVDVSFTDSPSGQEVLATTQFRIKVEANKGADRQCRLLAVPAWIDESAVLGEEQVERYGFATVRQAGRDPEAGWGMLMPVNDKYTMAVKGAGLQRERLDTPLFEELSNRFGTEEVYVLGYNNMFSHEDADIACMEKVSSVSFFRNGDLSDTDSAIEAVFPEEGNRQLFRLVINEFNEGDGVIAVVRSEDSVIAVISCSMTETYWPRIGYNDIRFSIDDSDPEGIYHPVDIVLEELTEGPEYETFKSYGIHVWHLVYNSAESFRNAMIYVPPFPTGDSSSVESSAPEWLSMEANILDGGKITVQVSMKAVNPELGTRGTLVFRAAGEPLFVLVCDRDYIKG